jgi:uncharacterized protein (TIGR02246 family)
MSSPGVDETAEITAILQVYSEYNQAASDKRFDDFAALFTTDGVIVSANGRCEGRAAIRAYIADRYADEPPFKMIWCNPVVRVAGTEATADIDWILVGARDGSTVLQMMGRTTNRLRKVDGRWLIAERRSVID